MGPTESCGTPYNSSFGQGAPADTGAPRSNDGGWLAAVGRNEGVPRPRRNSSCTGQNMNADTVKQLRRTM